ncbi:MAG: 3-hydroxybutyryl-CoA dehydrogenase [Desulfobacteraceae bacterium 4484_190.1]|nr:MAG: 3-hydroxybutyryl-CoA dehydrogenase [Desulfobacteraceae bacterium 4484_190.1]
MDKVGIVGCGLMGAGIVQTCAQAGLDVVTLEVNQDALDKGISSIDSVLAGKVNKGKMTQEDKEIIMGRIKGTTDYNYFSDCELVIEAVFENINIKKEVFKKLDNACAKDAILATNTSVLSVIDIASATSRPEKVLGMHFFFPVPVMKLLELVKTLATSSETLEEAKGFGRAIGKETIVAPDIPGFVVNRLFAPFQVSAIRMLEQKIATAEDIDRGTKLGLGHPMGMLELSDLQGLDTLLDVIRAFYDATGDANLRPPVLLEKMVAAGWLGRKTGRGFFEYK